MRRNLSFVARYLLRFTRCSLLVVKTFVTRCKIRSLLVAEVARCKKKLVTRCEIRAGCSLKKLLVVEIHSFSFQNSLVTRCRSCSLQKFIRYSLQNFLATRCRGCSLQKITRCSLRSALVNCCKK